VGLAPVGLAAVERTGDAQPGKPGFSSAIAPAIRGWIEANKLLKKAPAVTHPADGYPAGAALRRAC